MSEAMRERQALRDRVGEAALSHAAFDGWVKRTLHRAAEDAGVDRATVARLFPQGAESLLDWLADWADRQMVLAVDPEELARLPVRRRIARLVRARLEALTPHREAVRRAAIARSIDALSGGRELWRTVDRIWQAVELPEAADKGVGFYSRRATLAGVVGATFLYWLEDSSRRVRRDLGLSRPAHRGRDAARPRDGPGLAHGRAHPRHARLRPYGRRPPLRAALGGRPARTPIVRRQPGSRVTIGSGVPRHASRQTDPWRTFWTRLGWKATRQVPPCRRTEG